MKKRIVLISSLCSLAVIGMAVAGTAFANNGLKLKNVKAGENDYSITISRDTVQYVGGKYFVETSKGNRINLTRANCELFEDEDNDVPSNAFCYFRGNGGGLYIDSPFQSIATITTTFAFNQTTATNQLKLYVNETSNSFQDPHIYQSDASDSGTPYIPTDANDKYITYWYTSVGGTYHAEIQSIVITYTCA